MRIVFKVIVALIGGTVAMAEPSPWGQAPPWAQPPQPQLHTPWDRPNSIQLDLPSTVHNRGKFVIEVVETPDGRKYICIKNAEINDVIADPASALRIYKDNIYQLPDNMRTVIVVGGHGTFSIAGNKPTGIQGFENFDEVADECLKLKIEFNADGTVVPMCYSKDMSPQIVDAFSQKGMEPENVFVNRSHGVSITNQGRHYTNPLDGGWPTNGTMPADAAAADARSISVYYDEKGSTILKFCPAGQDCSSSMPNSPNRPPATPSASPRKRKVNKPKLGGGGGSPRKKKR